MFSSEMLALRTIAQVDQLRRSFSVRRERCFSWCLLAFYRFMRNIPSPARLSAIDGDSRMDQLNVAGIMILLGIVAIFAMIWVAA